MQGSELSTPEQLAKLLHAHGDCRSDPDRLDVRGHNFDGWVSMRISRH